MDFSDINFLAVLVATVLSFGVGFLWYGPLFGKRWQKEVGLTDEEMQNANMARIFGVAFIFTFVMALVLAMMLSTGAGWDQGMKLGATVGIGFVATALGVTYLFSRYSTALLLIDAIFHIVVLMIMGAIIGAWQ